MRNSCILKAVAAFMFLPLTLLLAQNPSNALSFDGIDDRVNIATTVPFSGNFTYEAWIRTNALSGSILSYGSPTVNNYVQFGMFGGGI
jgi:hypothetical protein